MSYFKRFADRSLRTKLPLISLLIWLLGIPYTPARAEQCPKDKPSWIQGRTIVFESNFSTPADRGVGEVFVYAFQPGASKPGTRYIAVSDKDGYFCIRNTVPGRWVLTSWEPFHYRPFVREVTCQAGKPCQVGQISLDKRILRISDDYTKIGSWGGPWAQTIKMPAGASHVVKITFRSGAASQNAVKLFKGQSVAAQDFVTEGTLEIPNNPGGGRGTAIFPFGKNQVTAGAQYTVVLEGGTAPWQVVNKDIYPPGRMFRVEQKDGKLHKMVALAPQQDLSLTLDVDGVDGLVTSFLSLGQDKAVNGSVIVQSFIARSGSITHASLFIGPPDGLRRVRASIHASLKGPAIGPVKETKGLQQQGVAFGWFKDEVKVTPGKRYYLKIHFPDGNQNVYLRKMQPLNKPNYPDGKVYVDGQETSGHFWGRIMGPVYVAPPKPEPQPEPQPEPRPEPPPIREPAQEPPQDS